MPTGILEKGRTFLPGDLVIAADLNNLVDLGNVLPGFIDSQTAVTLPTVNDHVLILQGTGPGTLGKSKLSELPAQVSSVGLAMPTSEFDVTGTPITTTGTLTAAWKPQPATKFFAGNGTGAGTTPSFRPIVSADLALPYATISAVNIDCALSNLFYKMLTTTPITFTFSNTRDGQTIKVALQQDGTGSRVALWPPGIAWKGAVLPVQSTTPSYVDIYEFTCIGVTVFGKGDMGYYSV